MMKRGSSLLMISFLALGMLGSGCSQQESAPASAQQAATPQSGQVQEQPKSAFHYTKDESKSLAENLLWDYFDAVNRHDYDGVFSYLSDELKSMYEYDDRIVYRNIESAKVKRIYDMTHQFPKPAQYVEARYFYVEVDYVTNHLYESNDKDGESYRMGIVARQTQNSPWKLFELSHVPKLKEVAKDAPEAPGTSIVPPQNPAQMMEQQQAPK